MAKLATRQRQDRYKAYINAVARVKGPAPTNPFRVLRLNANLTIQDLTELTGVSKQAIIRLEQGTYSEPVDRVLNFWIEQGARYNQDTDYVSLVNRYEHYQEVIRKRHARIFGNMPMHSWFKQHLDQHPFTLLRSLWQDPESLSDTPLGSMNVTECSKLLCIPQSVLDHFDNRIVRQGSVPKPLITALRQNGYRSDELFIFEQAYTDYRNFAINGVTPEETEAASKAAEPPVGNQTKGSWVNEILKEVNGA